VVNDLGEVLPADLQVLGKKTVKVPVGPANGTCDGIDGKKEQRDAVTLKLSVGTVFETVDVLAAAPHLAVDARLKCQIQRR
jgi:hypothetical protein